jgi:hypothetical protein
MRPALGERPVAVFGRALNGRPEREGGRREPWGEVVAAVMVVVDVAVVVVVE